MTKRTEIEVAIRGPQGVGKTQMARIIEEALTNYDIKAKFVDEFERRPRSKNVVVIRTEQT